MDGLDQELSELVNDQNIKRKVVYDSPNKVIAQLAEKLEEHIGDTP